MRININSLPSGIQVFEFKVDCSELDIENQDFSINEVAVKSTVSKNEQNVFVASQIRSEVDFVCDSCLCSFHDVLEDEFSIFYTSDQDSASHDGEQIIQVLKPGTREIDLSSGIRESILLSIPMKVMCSEDCQGLCPDCGANLNEGNCNCKRKKADPRWEGLKKFLGETPDLN